MGKRGRKSSAELATGAVDGRPARLKPPPSLSAAEQGVFLDIVASVAAGHFQSSDLPLLCRYAEAIALAELAAQEIRRGDAVVNGRPSAWITVQEKAVRAIVALSMRLRLSPQARKQYAAPPPRPMSYYERMAMEEANDG
jgi:hypothetical protein